MEISGNQIPLSKYVSIKKKTSPGDGKKGKRSLKDMSHLLYLIAEKEDLSEMEHYLSICSQKTTITSYLCSCCSGIIGTDTHLRKT